MAMHGIGIMEITPTSPLAGRSRIDTRAGAEKLAHLSSFKNYLCCFEKSTTWNWKHLGSRLCSLLILKSFLVGWSWKSGIIFYCDDDGGEGDDDDVGVDDDYAADDNDDVDDDYAADDVVDVDDDYAVDDDVDGDDDDDMGHLPAGINSHILFSDQGDC